MSSDIEKVSIELMLMGDARQQILAAGFEAREDLIASIESSWDALGRPGTWWTGSERVAMASEVRAAKSCPFCAECKRSVSPYAPKGAHESAANLPLPIVDVIHRCVTDPSRLSEAWFQRVSGGAISEGEYAEIVGTVATVVAVDRFLAALGLMPLELPAARNGNPVREEPPGAAKSYAWIRTVSTRDATGVLRRAWFGQGEPSFVPRVRQVLGLAPQMLEDFIPLSEAMYIPSRYISVPSWGRPPLTRRQNELVATRSAALNDCFY